MPAFSPTKITALASSMALVVGIGLGKVTTTDENGQPVQVPAPAPQAQPAAAPLDVAAYSQQARAFRDQNPTAVDLLTGPVLPGEQVTTGVNVDLGKRPGEVSPVSGSWVIDAVTFVDGDDATWIEVKATNTGATPARFVGMLEVP